MGILQFSVVGLFKFLLGLIALGAALYISADYLFAAGLLQEWGFPVFGLGVAVVVTALFGSLALVTKVMGLKGVSRFIVQCYVWVAAAFVFLCALAYSFVVSRYMGMGVFGVVIVLFGGGVSAYIAYKILSMLVGFFGYEFEKLANAMPGGRSVLFAEALSSGYNKPQTRAFINELTKSSGSAMGAGAVYTTLILYGIPVLVSIGIYFELMGK